MPDFPIPPFVLLDDSRSRDRVDAGLLFQNPVEILECINLEKIPEVLAKIEDVQRKGFYLAGWISYECGLGLHPTLNKPDIPTSIEPLIWMGVFNTPKRLSSENLKTLFHPFGKLENTSGFSASPDANETDAEFATAFTKIMDYISAGDIYQVNHTFRLNFEAHGLIAALYSRLRKAQPVAFGSLIDTGTWNVLSASPELFICRKGDKLMSRPMKGTARSGKTWQEIQKNMAALKCDEKNRAENLMITDLIRNDFSRVCEPGSVVVSKLFEVERFSQILQMSSEVVGILKPKIAFSDIFENLFPCGSITGAPKIRAMEIIQETEKEPRGLYTGALGYIAPSGDFTLSVPIRTVLLDKLGKGHMAVGSGIVANSTLKDEYDECLLKSHFIYNAPQNFALIETMLWTPNRGFSDLKKHLDRLFNSARYFEFPCLLETIKKDLKKLESSFDHQAPRRVRLTLSKEGKTCLQHWSFTPSNNNNPVMVTLASERVDSNDLFLFHKTTHRPLYDQAFKTAKGNDSNEIYDMIFQNKQGEITEGTFNSVFVEKDQRPLLTPPLKAGLLPGILRGKLLDSGRARETSLTINDLVKAKNIYLGNSVRGLVKTRLLI